MKLEAQGLPRPGWGETARQDVWSADLESNLPEEELWAGNWLPLPFLVHTDGDFRRAEVVTKCFFTNLLFSTNVTFFVLFCFLFKISCLGHCYSPLF